MISNICNIKIPIHVRLYPFSPILICHFASSFYFMPVFIHFSFSHFANHFSTNNYVYYTVLLTYTSFHIPTLETLKRYITHFTLRNINGINFCTQNDEYTYIHAHTHTHTHAWNVNVANITLYYVQLTINGLDFLHFSRWIDFVWMLFHFGAVVEQLTKE